MRSGLTFSALSAATGSTSSSASMSDKSASSPSPSAPLPFALVFALVAGFTAGLAAGLTGVFAGTAAALAGVAVVFLGSALAEPALALAAWAIAWLAGFTASAGLGFLAADFAASLPDFAAGAAVGFLDGVTGTEGLTFGMDFLGTALDTTGGVSWALATGGFFSGAALFALPGTVGLDAFSVVLLAFAGVLLIAFLAIVALIFADDLLATTFLAGALVLFTETAFFGIALVLGFALLRGAFALLVMADFLTGAAAALVLAALFAVALASGFTAALAVLAITFLAGSGLALAASDFFRGGAIFVTGFFAAGLDAFVFFGVGMVQPSVMKRIGWGINNAKRLDISAGNLAKQRGLGASCAGEHLDCSPCGRVAYVIVVTGWPVPEVLLSLLPKKWIIPILMLPAPQSAFFFAPRDCDTVAALLDR